MRYEPLANELCAKGYLVCGHDHLGHGNTVPDAEHLGFTVYGGEHAPYIWWKLPGGEKSFDFFDRLLKSCEVVGTPGSGFGACGEGYFRLTAFGEAEATKRALERIRTRLK